MTLQASGSRNQPAPDCAKTPLRHFESLLAQNPQQNPALVAEAVADVIARVPGSRPFRTEVDRIGMGEAVRGYNEHLAKLTTGLYANLGIRDLLEVRTGAPAAI